MNRPYDDPLTPTHPTNHHPGHTPTTTTPSADSACEEGAKSLYGKPRTVHGVA